jgi:hypothetical protein
MTGNNSNLRAADLDRLGKALITLAGELWVLKDRQRILETALQEKGVTTSELLDKYQPDTALAEQLAKDRAAFIEKLLNSLQDPDTE